MSSIPGQLADALVSALSTPAAEATVEGVISRGEIALSAALANIIKNAPKPGGVLALVAPVIESEITAEVQKLLTTYTPQEIVQNILLPAARAEAKALGG